MNDKKVTEIMKSIYGPTATQMMGGYRKSKAKTKKTKGAAAKPDFEIVAFPEYVDNSEFQKFMKEFYLLKRITHSYSATIYVIPEKKELDKMIADFKAELNKKNITEKSVEAYQYAAANDLPYKRCIFSVFADSNSNEYRLEKEAPPYKDFGKIKRTNLLSEQYYFNYKNDREILICPNKEDEKGATTAKLIAKCTNGGIYIFQGDLPKPKEYYTKKTAVKGFVGGSLKKKSLVKFNKLKQYINKCGETKGAEKFIAELYKGNTNKAEFIKGFSGDLLHSAFRYCFNANIEDKFSKVKSPEMRSITKKLINSYKPNAKGIDVSKFSQVFKKCYASVLSQSKTPQESSKAYINNIMKVYNKCDKDMIYADIATNIYRSNSYDNFQDIYNIIENFESVLNDNFGDSSSSLHIEYSGTSTEAYTTSKLCNYINNAIMYAPLVGLNAKTYFPQLQSIKSSEEEEMNMYGGYFENVYGLDVDYSDSEPDEKIEHSEDEKIEEIGEIENEEIDDRKEVDLNDYV